jgi:Tol biopolymer transport system component
MSATGQGDIIEVLGGDNDKSDATLSPDGHWIAFVSNESGRDEAYIRSWPDVSKARVQVSSNGARMPRWTRDGHELVFRSGTRVMSASIDLVTGASGKPVELFDATNLEPIYDITPDGSRFLMVHRVSGAASAPRVVVVTNWVQSLAKKFQ